MKLQINGFDIEVNTDDANMTIKVLDASGKELSNNTYNQSTESGEEINKVDMPSAEETTTPVQPEKTVQPAVQETEPAQTQPSAQPVQGEEQEVGESYMPDFETFKKLRKLGKI